MFVAKTRIKSAIWLVLLSFVLLACFWGCSEKTPNDDPITDVSTESGTEALGPIVETIRITVPIGISDEFHDYVKQLEGMLTSYGYTVTLGDDYLKKGEKAEEGYEIYIGSVDREPMTAFVEELGDYGWGIKQVGNKLCVAGSSEVFVKDAFKSLESEMFSDRYDPFGGVPETIHRYTDLLYLYRNGAPNLTITGDSTDADVGEVMASLETSIKRLTGAETLSGDVKVEIKRDNTSEFSAYNAVTFEPSENKIVLSAVERVGFEKIATEFYDMLRKMNDWKNTKQLAWPISYVCNLEINTDLPYIPYYKGSISEWCTLGTSYTVAIDSLSLEDFEAYAKKIESWGFVRDYTYNTEYEYDETIDKINTKEGTHKNTFYTYVGESGAIHLYHIGGTGHVRAVAITEKDYSLAKAAMNDKTDGEGDSEFILLDIGGKNQTSNPDLETYANGMCLVYQLSDGRFIVFDGGMTQSGDSESLEVVRLHQELLKRSPNGKVVIAAWIFTHMHGDHTLVATKYELLYGRQVEIQRYIHNIPTLEYALSFPNTDLSEGWYKGQVYPSVTSVLGRHDTVIARTGMVFNIGNATLEVLYSADDYYPTPLQFFNNSCLVIKLTIEGKSFLIAGDLQEDGQSKCVAQNGNLLNVNFVQATHHGYNMLRLFFEYSMAGELEGGRYAIWPLNKGSAPIVGNSETETGQTRLWLQLKVGIANNLYAFKGVQSVKLN